MIKVLIVDDQVLFTEMLALLLKDDSEINVVGTASDGRQALEKAKALDPDVILLDLMMPVCSGLDAIKLLRKQGSQAKILILTASEDAVRIREVVEMGADGYLLKEIGKNDLVLAIQSVASGLEIFDKNLLRDSGESGRRSRRAPVRENSELPEGRTVLNEREIRFLRLIARGSTVEEISGELYLAPGTVRNITTELIGKLNLRDRTQLAVYAIRNGLD